MNKFSKAGQLDFLKEKVEKNFQIEILFLRIVIFSSLWAVTKKKYPNDKHLSSRPKKTEIGVLEVIVFFNETRLHLLFYLISIFKILHQQRCLWSILFTSSTIMGIISTNNANLISQKPTCLEKLQERKWCSPY